MGLLIEKTIPTTAVAYGAGDSVGGLLELDGGVSGGKEGDLLHMLTVIDRSNQKAVLTLVLFDSIPDGATVNENEAFAWGTAINKVIAVIGIAAADYVTIDNMAVATITNVGCKMRGNGNSCYAALIATGTPTYAAGALTLKFGLVLNR